MYYQQPQLKKISIWFIEKHELLRILTVSTWTLKKKTVTKIKKNQQLQESVIKRNITLNMKKKIVQGGVDTNIENINQACYMKSLWL